MPKVSIIIPVYGVEKYIERCARSLFEQTLDDMEYLFIDDCTPDHSVEILNRVLKEYPLRKNQVVIHRMEKNSGQATVRKWGMLNATGDYVIHCDSDDWVDVTMYQKMYNKAVEENADIVVCDYVVTDDNSSDTYVTACHSVKPLELLENCLFQRDPWSLCNKLFKRTAYYKVVYPSGAMGEDMATTIQLLARCYRMVYVPEPLYHYFYNSQSITKVITMEACIKKYEQLFENSKIVLQFMEQTGLERYMKDALVVYKHFLRTVLYPLVWKKEYYAIWNNAFPGLNRRILLSKHISIDEKIRILLTIVHLYPSKRHRAK